MMTNVLEMLHTTAAYQTAVVQLMTGEASFAAQQLHLEGPPSISIPANTNEWEVETPPNGLSGYYSRKDYSYEFDKGRLRSIRKNDWLKKIDPPITNFWELSLRPSLLDTNTAYQHATQLLAAISVDVQEMERKYAPRIFQVPARKTDAEGRSLLGISNNVAQPLFMIGWGEDSRSKIVREMLRTNPPPARADRPNRPFREPPPSSSCPVFIEILGTTKELIELTINDESLFKRKALQLTNAAELLGPLPPPRHFVEELVGGKEAYETIARPDKVEAWLLTSSYASGTFQEKKDRVGPVKLKQEVARKFSDELLSFDSYFWRVGKGCMPDYGVRLRFTRSSDTVEFILCYECDILQVTHNSKTQEGNFDPAHAKLVNAIKSVFPNDEAIRNLK